jgi:hypothetical protein
MRESRSCGSVRAEGSNALGYSETLNSGRGQNIKYRPYAFTKHGAIQVANVLNSPRAVAMGVHVVRAFVQLCDDLLASNKTLAQKLSELEHKLENHDEAIAAILSAIRELLHPPVSKRRPIGFTADLEEKS